MAMTVLVTDPNIQLPSMLNISLQIFHGPLTIKMLKAKPQKDSRLLLLKGRKREKYRERNIIS